MTDTHKKIAFFVVILAIAGVIVWFALHHSMPASQLPSSATGRQGTTRTGSTAKPGLPLDSGKSLADNIKTEGLYV